MSYSQVEQLWESSRTVLQDCALPNGAIVAANSDLASYPNTAEGYRFSWMRDAAFQLTAEHALGMPDTGDIKRRYMSWLLDRVAGFAETGLYIKRYNSNGAPDERYGQHYQPDQAGAMLWALDESTSEPDLQTNEVMRLLANGLAGQWEKNHFKSPTTNNPQDLWENRETNPKNEDVFTYSLAAAAHGLDRAIKRLGDNGDVEADNWKEKYEEMQRVLAGVTDKIYDRKIYRWNTLDVDNTLDASLAGLAYPFVLPNATPPMKQRATDTVDAIAHKLYVPGEGVLRYEGDTYDGIVRAGSEEKTAGRWPLLTFWLAIAQNALGHRNQAMETYWSTIEQLKDHYNSGTLPKNIIPEQIYPDANRQGRGVIPLAWSHAKFVLATRQLGIM